MKFKETYLKGSYIITVEPHIDQRGFFERLFCKDDFHTIGFCKEITQINHSFSIKKGTLRGMHFQLPPHTETRIIKCIKGSVYDILIDLRKNSPTFLKWFGMELNSENNLAIFIPDGFAHGFQTLKSNTELLYIHTDYYMPGSEAGINYSDPLLGLKFPVDITEISARDKNHPYLSNPLLELPDF